MVDKHIPSRAYEILREEGILELARASKEFIQYHLPIAGLRFRTNTFKNKLQNQLRYEAPPSPISPIFVDPGRITDRSRRMSPPATGLGSVKGGTWDQDIWSIENDRTIQGLKQRFSEGKAWEDTVYYDEFKSKYNGNEERLRERCEFVDSLYHDIKTNGYEPASARRNARDRSGYGQYLEVLVNIDRHGNILHQGKGSHRLGIAKILDIRIPVQVLVRHKEWQHVRDHVHDGGFSKVDDVSRTHPDLQDVR